MARYRVLHWNGIPSLVEVVDDGQVVRRALSARFQELIDAVAMRQGVSTSAAYLDGWEQGPEVERAGGAEAVAEAVTAEIEGTFTDLAATRLAREGAG